MEVTILLVTKFPPKYEHKSVWGEMREIKIQNSTVYWSFWYWLPIFFALRKYFFQPQFVNLLNIWKSLQNDILSFMVLFSFCLWWIIYFEKHIGTSKTSFFFFATMKKQILRRNELPQSTFHWIFVLPKIAGFVNISFLSLWDFGNIFVSQVRGHSRKLMWAPRRNLDEIINLFITMEKAINIS